MTDLLRSEILAPNRPHVRHTLVVALGCGAIGAAVGLSAMPRTETIAPAATIQLVPVMIPAPGPAPSAQPVRSRELALVFSAGGASYMKLTEIGEGAEIKPKHERPRLVSDDGVEAAIANVQVADVPQAYRRWQGRTVKIDNTCETTVTGFAVVSRLTGETGYAGVDADSWSANNVLESGNVVLAARLAGCTGTFARDAALPPVIVPRELGDEALVSQARAALIESAAARDAQAEYSAIVPSGNWWDAEGAQLSAKIVTHPTTGVTWVSMHGHMDEGCGGPQANVWGLFRVEADGSLAAVQLRKLDGLWSIDQLVDLDNDGELEVIGRPWLGLDTVVVSASGEELARLSVPFFGCPC
jgi:hypothetical protein